MNIQCFDFNSLLLVIKQLLTIMIFFVQIIFEIKKYITQVASARMHIVTCIGDAGSRAVSDVLVFLKVFNFNVFQLFRNFSN